MSKLHLLVVADSSRLATLEQFAAAIAASKRDDLSPLQAGNLRRFSSQSRFSQVCVHETSHIDLSPGDIGLAYSFEGDEFKFPLDDLGTAGDQHGFQVALFRKETSIDSGDKLGFQASKYSLFHAVPTSIDLKRHQPSEPSPFSSSERTWNEMDKLTGLTAGNLDDFQPAMQYEPENFAATLSSYYAMLDAQIAQHGSNRLTATWLDQENVELFLDGELADDDACVYTPFLDHKIDPETLVICPDYNIYEDASLGGSAIECGVILSQFHNGPSTMSAGSTVEIDCKSRTLKAHVMTADSTSHKFEAKFSADGTIEQK